VSSLASQNSLINFDVEFNNKKINVSSPGAAILLLKI